MRERLTRRAVTTGAVTGLAATLAGCLGDGGDGVPDASFRFDRDETDLTVTHDGGDTLDSENTGEIQIVETSGEESAVSLGPWELPIAEGDTVTVQNRFESGQTVTVRWFSPDGEEFTGLASHDIE